MGPLSVDSRSRGTADTTSLLAVLDFAKAPAESFDQHLAASGPATPSASDVDEREDEAERDDTSNEASGAAAASLTPPPKTVEDQPSEKSDEKEPVDPSDEREEMSSQDSEVSASEQAAAKSVEQVESVTTEAIAELLDEATPQVKAIPQIEATPQAEATAEEANVEALVEEALVAEGTDTDLKSDGKPLRTKREQSLEPSLDVTSEAPDSKDLPVEEAKLSPEGAAAELPAVAQLPVPEEKPRPEPKRSAKAVDETQPAAVAPSHRESEVAPIIATPDTNLKDTRPKDTKSSDRQGIQPAGANRVAAQVETPANTAPSRIAQHWAVGSDSRSEKGNATNAPDQHRFVDRVAKAFRAAESRQGVVKLRLHPPELGSLRIELKMQQGGVSAKVEAETTAAHSLLLEHAEALRDRLVEQGVRIERFDVDLGDRRAAANFTGQEEQGSGQRRNTNSRESDGQAAVEESVSRTAVITSPGKLNVMV